MNSSSIVYTHSKSDFAHPFDLFALQILQELSIYRRWFLFGVIIDVNFQFTPWRVTNE